MRSPKASTSITEIFAPTFADWAGVDPPGFVDGRSLAPLLQPGRPAGFAWRTAILNEHGQRHRFIIPDYQAVRTRTHTYVQWKTGERELYDVRRDPYELENINQTAAHLLSSRLKTRLQSLATCEGSTCVATEGP